MLHARCINSGRHLALDLTLQDEPFPKKLNMTKSNENNALVSTPWSVLLQQLTKRLRKYRAGKQSFFGKTVLVVGLAMSLVACKELFQYSPHEIRLLAHEKNVNARQIAQIASLPAKDTFRFIVMGDTQRFYEEVEDFVQEVNHQPDIAFVVLAGDISDF